MKMRNPQRTGCFSKFYGVMVRINDVHCRKEAFIKSVKRDLANRVATIIVSHPFHVITIRMMAQFVGREARYS